MEPIWGPISKKEINRLTEKYQYIVFQQVVCNCRQNTAVGSPPLVGSAAMISEPAQDAMGVKTLPSPP